MATNNNFRSMPNSNFSYICCIFGILPRLKVILVDTGAYYESDKFAVSKRESWDQVYIIGTIKKYHLKKNWNEVKTQQNSLSDELASSFAP